MTSRRVVAAGADASAPAASRAARLLAVMLALALCIAPAAAHGYRAGPLEIRHPVAMVPDGQQDCSCAHVTIINHGPTAEYLLGAVIENAARTHMVVASSHGSGLDMPLRLVIPPGGTLDLSRHGACLFMSGLTRTLEADIGVLRGQLLFARQGAFEIEFVIAAGDH